MSRSSYDDMPDSRMNNRYSGNKGKTGLIAIAGILIALLCIILFLIFTPSDGKKNSDTAEEVVRAVSSSEPEIPEIFIPEPDPEPVTEETDEESKQGELINEESAPENGSTISWKTYIWKEGDTLNSVATEFGITTNTIISVNKIANIAAIKKGTMLNIPSADGQVYELKPSDTLETLASRFNPSISAEELGRINNTSDENLSELKEIFIPAAVDDYIESAFPSFILPINGTVSVLYGEYYNGRRIDGIVLKSHPGEAVRAALSGFVVDTGYNQIYGKFASIMHDNGYKTTYSALESVDVKTGDNVEKGSVIGSVGDSNMYFGTPSLLFTIEQSGIKIDPMNVLDL